MVTVIRERGFFVRILTNDHPPPHVHVQHGDGRAKICLGDRSKPPELVEVVGMTKPEALAAFKLVAERRQELLTAWENIHGQG